MRIHVYAARRSRRSMGYFLPIGGAAAEIVINYNYPVYDRVPTLLHELAHAAAYASGDGVIEEIVNIFLDDLGDPPEWWGDETRDGVIEFLWWVVEEGPTHQRNSYFRRSKKKERLGELELRIQDPLIDGLTLAILEGQAILASYGTKFKPCPYKVGARILEGKEGEVVPSSFTDVWNPVKEGVEEWVEYARDWMQWADDEPSLSRARRLIESIRGG